MKIQVERLEIGAALAHVKQGLAQEFALADTGQTFDSDGTRSSPHGVRYQPFQPRNLLLTAEEGIGRQGLKETVEFNHRERSGRARRSGRRGRSSGIANILSVMLVAAPNHTGGARADI